MRQLERETKGKGGGDKERGLLEKSFQRLGVPQAHRRPAAYKCGHFQLLERPSISGIVARKIVRYFSQ